MSNSTLIIDLNNGQDRAAAENTGTLCGRLIVDAIAPDFRGAFVANYAQIRGAVARASRRGVVAIAIHRRRVVATATLASSPDGVRALTIGRHGQADIFIDDDPDLSLRHLMLLTHADPGADDVRFRLLDLRSAAALVGEDGHRLEALEAEGPVFVLLGRTMLFVFPVTTQDPRWPASARDAWACIPERVYFNERARDELPAAESSRVEDELEGLRTSMSLSGQTLVERLPPPHSRGRDLVAADERPLGRVVIDHAGERAHLIVGRGALRRGLLLGRYSRCDNAGIEALTSHSISRVHLLIIELGGHLQAIDAGSTNGVYRDATRVRQCHLTPSRELSLCRAIRIRWAPYH